MPLASRFLSRKSCRLLASLVALLLLGSAPLARAQGFVRITDPANPVVTDLFESGGGSWFDVDGDGDLDLFVPHGNLANQNNALYLNLGGFAFRKVVTGPVVGNGGSSIGGTWGDFDRDGHVDLFVTNRNNFGNFLYRGLGDTSFVRDFTSAPAADIANSNSASWVDVDGDGDLDLYVVNFQGDDFLYVNSGTPAWTLSRVSPAWTTGAEFSIHGAWADVDNDGDMDLFIGNAGTQNDYLFVNGGGLSFTKRTLFDGRSSLGGSWGDFDGDGFIDLFVANYLGQASILYRNSGPPGFDLVPVSTGVFPSTIGDAVGSAWGDVDDDGDLDLLVGFDNGQNEALFLNSGPPGWSFTRVTTGAFTTSAGNSFGASLADVDGDGDLDAFVANRANQADQLYRNDTAPGAWLELRLHGVISNPQAIGTRVRLLAAVGGSPRWQSRQVLPISGYNSQNLDLHFGLGGAGSADSIEIVWSSGVRQVLTGVTAGQRLDVVEDVSTAALASLVSVEASTDAVTLLWSVTATTGASVEIERSSGLEAWRGIGESGVDGTGRVRFTDRAVTPGAEYDYRLSILEADGRTLAGQTRVTVPRAATLALAVRPSPDGGLRARLSLPVAGEVRLELFDAGGRRCSIARDLLGAGEHELEFPGSAALPAGLYFARLAHAAGTRTARAFVVR